MWDQNLNNQDWTASDLPVCLAFFKNAFREHRANRTFCPTFLGGNFNNASKNALLVMFASDFSVRMRFGWRGAKT
jgi:hypothetical protein